MSAHELNAGPSAAWRPQESRPGELVTCGLQGGEYLDLVIRELGVSDSAMPGQFVMIRGWTGDDPLFGRPFDVVEVDPEEGTFRLVVKVTGRGTRLLDQLRPGDKVQVVGPLGRGIRDFSCDSLGLLVRGVGAAAVVFLAEQAKRQGVEVVTFLSASTARRLVCRSELQCHSSLLEVVTDDGSAGHGGEAISQLEMYLTRRPLARLYTCGSRRFAQAVQRLDAEGRTQGFLFLEERMACGLGYCHGCAVVRTDSEMGEEYLLVCRDGPVFPASQVKLA